MDAAARRWAAVFIIVLGLVASIGSARDPVLGAPDISFTARPSINFLIDTRGRPIATPAAAGSTRPGARTAVPGNPDDPALRAAIEAALPPGDLRHASVVVRRIYDGRGVDIDGGREFYAASTFKLAVVFALERAAARGEIDLDSYLDLTAEDAAEDLGTLGSVPRDADGRITIRAAATAAISLSDNATAVSLLHHLTGRQINDELRSIGAPDMDVNTTDLPTDARDLATLMEAIVRGDGMDAAGREAMRRSLLGQRTRNGIPAGLPPDITVGNKTGTWEGITHDVAFVDAPTGTYIIAILTDEGWNWERIRRISEAVYEVMAGG